MLTSAHPRKDIFAILVIIAAVALVAIACRGSTPATPEEYARAVCEFSEAQSLDEDDITNGAALDLLNDLVDRIPAPPDVYRDYHAAVMAAGDLLEEWLDDQDEDAPLNVLVLISDGEVFARALILGMAIQGAEKQLPDDAKQILADAGCDLTEEESGE